MSPETVFNLANALAFFAWAYLILGARWTPRLFSWVRAVIPVSFAILYLVALALAEPNDEAGFQTLAQVSALFTQPWALVAGWLHYLAFDFFVGCWMLERARMEEIGHGWIVIPILLGKGGGGMNDELATREPEDRDIPVHIHSHETKRMLL